MNIKRSEFLAACFLLLGEDYGRRLLDANYNPQNFCELVAQQMFIGNIDFDSSERIDAINIVVTVARKLNDEGTHGLLEG